MVDYLKTEGTYTPSNDQLTDAAGNFLFAAETVPEEEGIGLIPTSTVVVSSPNPSTYGAIITCTATVTPVSGGPVTGTVQFFASVSPISGHIALDGASQAEFDTSALSVGSHDISVRYDGDATFETSDSGIIAQVVTAGVAGPVIVADRVLDNGLSVLADEADMILLCHTEPTSYLEAFSTFALAVKDFGSPGNAFGSISSGSPGRMVGSTPIMDGAIIASGVITYWATVNSDVSELLARGPVVTPQAVSNGNQFALPSFTITMPGQ